MCPMTSTDGNCTIYIAALHLLPITFVVARLVAHIGTPDMLSAHTREWQKYRPRRNVDLETIVLVVIPFRLDLLGAGGEMPLPLQILP